MSKSTQTFGPPPQLHTKPMSYGVELEFVFGFQQVELELGHTNGVPNTLKKNLKYIEREEYPKFTKINPRALPNHTYNSWAILEGGDINKMRPVSINSSNVYSQATVFSVAAYHFYPLSQSRLVILVDVTKLTC